MKDFIKAFFMPVVIFLSMAYATLSHGCDMSEAVYPETVETPSITFSN
jgi:hypothetical protein